MLAVFMGFSFVRGLMDQRTGGKDSPSLWRCGYESPKRRRRGSCRPRCQADPRSGAGGAGCHKTRAIGCCGDPASCPTPPAAKTRCDWVASLMRRASGHQRQHPIMRKTWPQAHKSARRTLRGGTQHQGCHPTARGFGQNGVPGKTGFRTNRAPGKTGLRTGPPSRGAGCPACRSGAGCVY